MTSQTEERPETAMRVRRVELGLTQEQLATLVQCDQTTISDIELGEANPSLKLARALAAALESTLDDLFGEAMSS